MSVENLPKYIEGDLLKKEDSKKWVTYWSVVQGNYIIFYNYREPLSELKDFYGCIDLNKNTRCVVAKRKNYSFPFYIVTDRARYLFKTKSNLVRHQWLSAIDQASKGIPPNVSKCLRLPTDCIQRFDSSDTIKFREEISEKENIQNEEEEETEEEENDNCDFELSTNLVYVNSNPTSQQTSRFLERTFSHHEIEERLFEDDLHVSDMQTDDPERFAQRLHEIYCQDSIEDGKTTDHKSKPPVQSFGYPTESKSKYLSSGVARLTKSVESLRGVSLETETMSSQTHVTFSSHQIFAKKNLFSRHMVNSAPDVNSKFSYR